MNIYCLKEELGKYDLEDIIKKNLDWLVYHYERGDYEGSGYAVSSKDGVLREHNLGHCSCYGPVEQWGETEVPPEYFLEFDESIFSAARSGEDEVKMKVREILIRS